MELAAGPAGAIRDTLIFLSEAAKVSRELFFLGQDNH